MMPAQHASVLLRFSTDGLPDEARAQAVRELYERTSLPGKIEPLEPLQDCPVRVDISKQAFPGLGVMEYGKPLDPKGPSLEARTIFCSLSICAGAALHIKVTAS